MQATTTISVRLDANTRQVLAERAAVQGATGASGLARDILTQWAAHVQAAQKRAGVERAAAYLKEHSKGWADEPADFFPGITSAKKTS